MDIVRLNVVLSVVLNDTVRDTLYCITCFTNQFRESEGARFPARRKQDWPSGFSSDNPCSFTISIRVSKSYNYIKHYFKTTTTCVYHIWSINAQLLRPILNNSVYFCTDFSSSWNKHYRAHRYLHGMSQIMCVYSWAIVCHQNWENN